MSNLGANIWTTGDAIENPEISGVVVNAGGGDLGVSAHVFAGNLTGSGGGSLTATVEVNGGWVNNGGGTLTAEIAMFAGNLNGGGGSYSLGPMFIAGGNEYMPVLQGGTIIALAEIVGTGRFPNKGGADLVADLAMFAGNITGGGGSYSLGPMFIEGGGLAGAFANGLVRLSGLGIILPLTGDVLDSIEFSATATSEQMVILRDAFSVLDTLDLSGSYLNVLGADELRVRAALSIPYMVQAFEAIDAAGSESTTAYKLVTLADQAGVFSSEDSTAVFQVTLAAALALQAHSDAVLNLTLSDSLQLLAANSASVAAGLAVAEALTAAATSPTSAIFVADIPESLEADDVPDTQAWLQVFVDEGVDVFVSLKVGDEVIQGWVVNTQLSAFSEYQNFPFNSLMESNGKFYGVAQDGLYELTGDTDAGTPIQAAFKTGLLDLGSHFLKDAKAAHLGYTSTGKLVLKVTTTAKGQKEEWWYELKQSAAASMRDGRFTIGRGLRAKYWQFEIVNVDGADFEVDDVQIMYSVLSRRIR